VFILLLVFLSLSWLGGLSSGDRYIIKVRHHDQQIQNRILPQVASDHFSLLTTPGGQEEDLRLQILTYSK